MSGNEEQKITAMLMIEVLGRPKEHLIETLKTIEKKIGEERGVEVVDSKIKEPVPVKDKENLFTTFAEIEVELNHLQNLSVLAFKYMPAHIEIIEPEHLRITNNEYADTLSEIIRRLHKYDELLRVMQMEKRVLEKKLNEKK
jgi:hypothetical protein